MIQQCRKLRNEYCKIEEAKIPSYYWKHAEGEKYLRPEVYDSLFKRCDAFYISKLEEAIENFEKQQKQQKP